jgi:hypothetical protein
MSTFFRCLLMLSLFGCATKHAFPGDQEFEEDAGLALGASGQGFGGGGSGIGGLMGAKGIGSGTSSYGRGGANFGAKGAPPSPSSAMAREGSRAARKGKVVESAVADSDEAADSEEGKDGEAQPRMVHYNGHIKLQVTRPAETIEAVVERIKAEGGFVESQTLSRVSLRVPVAKFRDTYDWVLGQGDVLSRSMSARDVTDAHFAMDLRMRTARKTRDRLQELLARAQDEDTKIALLKQIQRLTELVDRMERQLKTLSGLADMSRLTLETRPRSAMAGADNVVPVAGFEWIAELSPFSRSVAEGGKAHKLPSPEGLVALSSKDHHQAESADGVVFWTARLDNRPEGSAEFWRAAIIERIAEEFGAAKEGQVGEYLTLRLVSPAEEPYIYTIAIQVDGDELLLVETYYPTQAAEQRHSPNVQAVLGGGAT